MSTKNRVALKPAEWPERDQALWVAAQQTAGFLEAPKPASRWGPRRRRIIEQAYGQWLMFLRRAGALDPEAHPAARATEERMRLFIDELRQRVAPVSVVMMLDAVRRMLEVLDPERDWRWLCGVCNALRQTAVASRNKATVVVPASEVFELGVSLMKTWEEARNSVYRAARYRDGLMIALLISNPVRMANFKSIVIGKHLSFDGKAYLLEFAGHETKTGSPYLAEVPSELTPYIERYLAVHRKTLLRPSEKGDRSDSVGQPLWIDRNGRPMFEHAIRDQIRKRTEQAFGHHLWPHLFRDCGVTELVDEAPEEIGIAPDVLTHASLRTTQKHYLHAQGMKAHRAFQGLIANRRRARVRSGLRERLKRN